jgi:penicillin-binding protein 1B
MHSTRLTFRDALAALAHPKVKVLIFVFSVIAVLLGGYSVRLWLVVSDRLQQGVFSDTSDIYAAPRTILAGSERSLHEIVADLRSSGYSENATNRTGFFRASGSSLEIHPGPDSETHQEPVRLDFQEGRIPEITSLNNHSKLASYTLDPELLTNMSTESRDKRRIVKYAEIPKVLINAVLAAEDKSFFSHSGFDPLRIVKASYVNMKSGRKEQGGSTLTMQLARNLWLEPEKTWTRKAREFLITLMLEDALSKQQIFEHYCNQVYLGRHETFSIRGFGEAAHRYFDKEVGRLTLPEAATLAGLVQRPSVFDPVRHPEAAQTRRNAILNMMLRNGYISEAEHAAAAKAPLGITPPASDANGLPYFLALANDELQTSLDDSGTERTSYRVYTTLDYDLQHAAVEAVRAGLKEVDGAVRRKHPGDRTLPQVALIALDPKTGEIKAAVGGRSYRDSQLNHILSKRQPGSAFKPFVYAAAMETQLNPKVRHLTAATVVDDEPTTFRYGDEIYTPTNFGQTYNGPVTLRRALARSLNIPTVILAQKVGYRQVVDLAKRAGLNEAIRATPAVALGAYETTPLEIAGAYTIFTNEGEYVKPTFIRRVRSAAGEEIQRNEPKRHAVLDPRIAFLMRDMLQEVIRNGTASGLYSRGFSLPAAGKTGTSRDGWFAGFTSGLICVVWVGYDDNRELDLEGSKSALPIWAEFMKRAVRYGDYARQFPPPPRGVTSAQICPETGELAGESCPNPRNEFFIPGSEPRQACSVHDWVPPYKPGEDPVLDRASFSFAHPADSMKP